jgi:5-methylcytosine-specific restriction endonuclease McrA
VYILLPLVVVRNEAPIVGQEHFVCIYDRCIPAIFHWMLKNMGFGHLYWDTWGELLSTYYVMRYIFTMEETPITPYNNDDDNNKKRIILSFISPEPKPKPAQRKITSHPSWVTHVPLERQWELLEDEYEHTIDAKFVHEQIRSKRGGYKYQDVKKGWYSPADFVTIRDIVALLKESRHMCFYCRQPVYLLYDYVREQSQWTLDRLNNNYGHNRENVVIACLACNLHRRTTYHKRFKQSCDIGIHGIVKIEKKDMD